VARKVTLGRIIGVFGVQGWVRIASETRPVENILKYRRWWIQHGSAGEFEAKVLQGRRHGGGVAAQISGPDGEPITDRDVAAALIGAELRIDRAKLPKLPAGEYYWVDLLGLEVRNLEGVVLGKVNDMTSNGAQDVMVLKDGELERLIPYVPGPIVKHVDPAAGVIVCDWQPDYG
jgi:16S rRNA processing protein RimM